MTILQDPELFGNPPSGHEQMFMKLFEFIGWFHILGGPLQVPLYKNCVVGSMAPFSKTVTI